MNANPKIAEAIRHIISNLMNRVMEKVLVIDPFIPEEHHAKKPLYAALIPDEIFKGSHFERRFVTPFGNVWEQLAVAVASIYHGECFQGYTVEGTVGENSLRRIQEVLNRLEHGTQGKRKEKPDWNKELEYVLSGGGNPIPVSVTCDIYIPSILTGKKYAFELKAPLPNSDQTKVSKEKMFKLLAMNEHPVDYAYYALVYNPYGAKSDYVWSYPKRWFNMIEGPCVLIGEELWDLIGGKGTYKEFVSEINKLGKEYKKEIYCDYLNIEAPVGFDNEALK